MLVIILGIILSKRKNVSSWPKVTKNINYGKFYDFYSNNNHKYNHF